MQLERPASSEYNDFYSGYVAKAEDDPISHLERQAAEVRTLVRIGEMPSSRPPAPGEWSAKEILAHLCDFERVFAYRALRFSRDDRTPLAGFEQEPYVAASGANDRPLAELVEEFASLRRGTVLMFAAMDDATLDRRGEASGWPVTVRALLFIMAGHCEGHLADIRRDYLGNR